MNNLPNSTPNGNIFTLIKREITAADAFARYLGHDLRRSGARWVARCPFHDDDHPSLVIYADGWKCFGCGAGGDVIAFAARLFGLRPLDAARKLAEDFCLPLPTRPVNRADLRRAVQRRKAEEHAVAAFRARVQASYDQLAALYRLARAALHYAPDPFALPGLIKSVSVLDFLLDELLSGDAERQLAAIETAAEEGFIWVA